MPRRHLYFQVRYSISQIQERCWIIVSAKKKWTKYETLIYTVIFYSTLIKLSWHYVKPDIIILNKIRQAQKIIVSHLYVISKKSSWSHWNRSLNGCYQGLCLRMVVNKNEYAKFQLQRTVSSRELLYKMVTILITMYCTFECCQRVDFKLSELNKPVFEVMCPLIRRI